MDKIEMHFWNQTNLRPPSNSYMDLATLGVALVNPKPRPYMVKKIQYIGHLKV